MALSRSSKSIIAGTIAFSVLAGPFVVPAPISYAATVSSNPFSDVASNHWAQKHITKLSFQGIINGSNGLFRPADNVTQQEAVLMALRFIGAANEAPADDTVAFPETFVIKSDFKGEVKLAFDKGLLDQAEEYALAASGDQAVGWGQRPATREWVTKLLIRAINQKSTADSLQNAVSSFNDADQIASSYRGYVNAAVSLDLVKGITAVKFDPKANVNRASLATLFSRAEKLYPVEYAGQATGVLLQASDTGITIYSKEQSAVYTLSANTAIYRYDSETPIAAKDLVQYANVTVITKSGAAAYVELQDDKPQIKTITGTVGRVLPDQKLLYVWIDNKPVEVYYDDSLIVAETSGKTIAISDLKENSAITVTQDTFRTSPKALKITVDQQTGAAVLKGTFISGDASVLTYEDSAGKLNSKFLSSTIEIIIEGIVGPTIGDLIKDVDQLQITTNDQDQITKIEVINRNVQTLVGAQVESYNADKKFLVVFDSTGTKAYPLYLTEKTRIDNNGNAIKLDDIGTWLTKNRKLTITYSGDKVVSLSIASKYTGKLVSINGSSNSVTLSVPGGVDVTVAYSAPTVEVPGIAAASLTDLKVGDTITTVMNVNQDRATLIQVHRPIQYEVRAVNTGTKKVTVVNAQNVQTDLVLSGIDITNETGSKVAIDTLVPGTLINVSYIGKQMIAVKSIVVSYGTVQSVGTNSITLTNENGQTITVALGQTFFITKGTSTSATTSTLATGDRVQLSKNENDVVQVTVAVGQTRTFWQYDATAGQLWTLKMTDADNANYFYVTGATKLLKDGKAISLQDIKYGDQIIVYAFKNKAVEIVKV
ncbi:S-layer homology domain-containing protein [Paenibacillus sp. FSL H8-0537]|uniref:S-layer homology domain-containing protein n=1 Tax=Paenibacillus sp. FSL H8-0537 TaxID=2921399 RepID=UPI0031015AF3